MSDITPPSPCNEENTGDTEQVNNATDKKASRGGLSFFKIGKPFWIGIALLVILLIFSTVILSIRLFNFSQLDKRAVSLKSNMDAKLEVFSIEYKNGSGEISIESSDGQNVIAPGAQVEYTLRIRNTDKTAIDYKLSPNVELLSKHRVPIVVRLIDPNGEYIVGSATKWVDLESLNTLKESATLLSGDTVEYTFQWKWPYESGNDTYDTFLGNETIDSRVGANITFSLHAEANTTIEDNGGIFGPNTGDIFFIVIFLILLILAIILLIISIIKRIKPAPAPIPEPVAVPEPIVAPEPVVSEPIPLPELKFKRFTGKMAIINLDTLCEHFADGDLITLAILKNKGLMSANTKQMKILARRNDKLDRAFTIETQAISNEALKQILSAGGSVVITEG